ncbi:MAG: hypothetical protein ACJ74G_24375 [Blastocatellia bacterium]|jgi:hypothetical protein
MAKLNRDFAEYMGNDFWDEIVRDSEARLANPLPFALEALEDLFGHGDDKEQGFKRFQMKLESFLWWADDAVQCLEKVVADPPPHLGDLVRRQAGVVVWVPGSTGETIGNEAEHEAWLRATVARLRAMFDAYVAEKTAEMKAQQKGI